MAGMTGTIDAQVAAGSLLSYAGSSAPTGFLLCDGAAVSRTAYSVLFVIISTTYGVGDGSTTFNLPDLRGRAPIGLDNMGASSANRITDAQADSLGGSMGAEDHTLSESELAAHLHSYIFSPAANIQLGGTSQNAGNATGANTGNTGGGSAHNNVQPTLFLNYIIKT